MSYKLTMTIAGICILCLTSYFVWQTTSTNIPLTNVSSAQQTLNGFITAAEYIDYDHHGNLHSRLHARHVRQYTDDLTLMQHPHGLIYTKAHRPWQIAARHGKTQQADEGVFLWDHVKLHQAASQEQPETTVHSASMWYYPKQSLARTNDLARIQQGQSHFRGHGVDANLVTGVLRVKSQSQGIYAAPRHQSER